MTFSSGTVQVSDGIFQVTDTVTNGNLTTLATSNTATYSVSGSRTIRGGSLSTESSGVANNTGIQQGLLISNTTTQTGTLDTFTGLSTSNSATSMTAGTISSSRGLQINASGSASDGTTVTNSFGIDVIADTALSDFTNAYGVKILLDGDTGSVGTNRYALHITEGSEALGGSVTNEYGIFQVGSAQNQLADLDISDVTPHLRLTDSTAAQDDFEWYADASQVYLTNVTDAVELLRWSSANALFLRGSAVTYAWPTADGTNGQFLTTNGSGTMTWTTSSGSGDITDVYNCASGDCNSIVLADGDLLSFAGVSVSTTTEGLILPQHATDCSTAGTAEGQVCWEADANTLYVGNGATVTQVGAGSDTNADKEFVWPMSALLPLEAADSIPPLAKDASTTFDFLPVDFDQSTDEGRTYTCMVPPDMTSCGTVTFGVVWYAASVTTNNVMWATTQNGGVAEGVDPDVSSTTEAAAADAVQGTAGQITITTWTQTTTNLNWTASDFVTGVIFRDANHASDTLAADARAVAFFIRIPRS